ncbi:PIG-L family deacetylase [Paraoerskovia sediminicola]|uniref:PIG-L family deacetylase n=1 Tax=Paraoerskovia sediminicola TaxID=1138587 RepID=UPI00257460EA|nr:PIG-L family deacetylase [Paraoerskovia sediminicola]
MSFDHREEGTPEESWRQAGILDRPVRWDLPDDVAHLVVLAAHPDDETLGAGGLLARAARAGLATTVLVATDGEGSHPASGTYGPAEVARLRRYELLDATHALATGATLHLAGLPDGGLREAREPLARAVRAAIATHPGPTVVCAPWRGDPHRDHRVLGEVAAEVVGSDELLEYPIWAWHRADPSDPGGSAAALPWDRLRGVRLSDDELGAKREALRAHRSQVDGLSSAPGDEPVLHAGMLAHFTREVEVFVAEGRAVEDGAPGAAAPPSARASLPEEFFAAFYARHTDPWGFESRWYEQRKREITLAALPEQRYADALEVGCSTGVLTVALAARCDRVLGIDIADRPLAVARERLPGHVRLEKRTTPDDWPEGRFDLVVLSEVGYYWGGPDLDRGVDRAVGSLASDGVLVACHWRHPVEEYPTSGDDVHRVLQERSGLATLVHHEEEDFVLDVLVPAPAASVARRTGLL